MNANNRGGRGMEKIYFSCPHFTVLLMLEGAVIRKAAPIVRRFEGQTIDALTAWAKAKFGGPIIVEKLPLIVPPGGK